MDPQFFNRACGVIDPGAVGAWCDWIRSWRATNQPLPLTELPDVALRIVMERSNVGDRVSLRNVCYGLRQLSDSTPCHCRLIELSCNFTFASLLMDSQEWYTSSISTSGLVDRFKLLIRKVNPILRIPTLKIDQLVVKMEECPPEIREMLQNFLSTLPLQISVKQLFLESSEPSLLLYLLQCIKPGSLQVIKHTSQPIGADEAQRMRLLFREIRGIEQWKQAKTLRISVELHGFIETEGLVHFKEVEVLIILPPLRFQEHFRQIELHYAHLREMPRYTYFGIDFDDFYRRARRSFWRILPYSWRPRGYYLM